MGADEERTLEHLKALRRELLDPKISERRGRIVKRRRREPDPPPLPRSLPPVSPSCSPAALAFTEFYPV
jgi:hypothetical protein